MRLPPLNDPQRVHSVGEDDTENETVAPRSTVAVRSSFPLGQSKGIASLLSHLILVTLFSAGRNKRTAKSLCHASTQQLSDVEKRLGMEAKVADEDLDGGNENKRSFSLSLSRSLSLSLPIPPSFVVIAYSMIHCKNRNVYSFGM